MAWNITEKEAAKLGFLTPKSRNGQDQLAPPAPPPPQPVRVEISTFMTVFLCLTAGFMLGALMCVGIVR